MCHTAYCIIIIAPTNVLRNKGAREQPKKWRRRPFYAIEIAIPIGLIIGIAIAIGNGIAIGFVIAAALMRIN